MDPDDDLPHSRALVIVPVDTARPDKSRAATCTDEDSVSLRLRPRTA